MKTPTPAGFYVCGLGSACLGLAMLVAMLVAMLGPGFTRGDRVWAMVMAALAGVTTEALWRARPWVWRASCSLALVYTSSVLAELVALHGTGAAQPLMGGVLMFSVALLILMLGYIHTRSQKPWPRARVAVTRARP